MRIAVTKGTLEVPPTYFAVQHAVALARRHSFRFFTGAADIGDQAALGELVVDDASRAVPLLRSRPYSQRDLAAPFLRPVMTRAIARWQPDIIHQHFATLSGAALAAHRRTGAPLAITLHGADVYVALTPPRSAGVLGSARLAVHQAGVQKAFDAADRIFAVSQFLADRAVEAGADADRVVVHYQGIDTDRYTPQPVEQPDIPQIAFVGALTAAKGVPDLIAQSIRLVAEVPHHLVLVGDGPLRGSAERAASEHPHIRVRGTLTQDGVRDVLAHAKVLAFPTRGAGLRREAAGLVTLEAQAMGVPAVVYDSGGAKEMLEHERTGLVVPESDAYAFGDALRSMLELSDAAHASMGERARDFVVRHRSLARSADELSAHYEELAR